MLASIPAAQGPLRIGLGVGSVWVADHRGTYLYRIDPSTNQVTARIDLGQESCGAPSIGFGKVWVSGCGPGEVMVVDARTDQVVGSLHEPGFVLGFGAGSAWVGTFDGHTARIDPNTLRRQAAIGRGGEDVVFANGSVWVSNASDATVERIDPATNRVTATMAVGFPGTDELFMSFVDGRLWLYPGLESAPPQDPRDDRIWSIDPRDNTVTEHRLAGVNGIDQILGGALIAGGMGSLWIRVPGGDVHRFDGRTLKPLGTVPADNTDGGFVAVGFGSVWTSNLNAGTVWRSRV